MEKKSPHCRVCDGSEVQERLYPKEMMFGMREQFTYFRCAACGCLQLEEIPANFGKYYPANYYSYQNPQDEKVSFRNLFKRKFIYPPMTKHILGWKSIVGHILCHLMKHPPVPVWLRFLGKPIPLNGGILDVGCGSGMNLLTLRDCGFTNLLGVDPFISKPLSYEGGVRIDKCDLQTVQGEFSLIMLHHVFEHLDNPLETLQKARQLLVKGGQILIRIPLSDSVAAERYKEKWVQLDAPRHITLHTRKSMEFIAKKTGLKITRVTYDSSDFQFWGSEQYLLDIPLTDPRSPNSGTSKSLFSLEQFKAFAVESEQLNRQEKGDQAAFVLEMVQP